MKRRKKLNKSKKGLSIDEIEQRRVLIILIIIILLFLLLFVKIYKVMIIDNKKYR